MDNAWNLDSRVSLNTRRLGAAAFDWSAIDWNGTEAWAIHGGTNWPMGLPLWIYAQAKITPPPLDMNNLVGNIGIWRVSILRRIIPESPVGDPAEHYARICGALASPVGQLDPMLFVVSSLAGIIFTAMQTIDGVASADAESDVIGRPWGYDKKIQQAKIDEINASLDALRDAIASKPLPTASTSQFNVPKTPLIMSPAARAAAAVAKAFLSPELSNEWHSIVQGTIELRGLYPKSASDLAKDPAWKTIAKGTATAAAAFIAAVAAPGAIIAVIGGQMAKQATADAQEKAAKAELKTMVEEQVAATKFVEEQAKAEQLAALTPGAMGVVGGAGAAAALPGGAAVPEETPWLWYAGGALAAVGLGMLAIFQIVPAGKGRRK